ncbi:hypothetical protein CLV30_10195 [Haloactinopolyspora alba]|uniref:Uncharacterized protein n=1 Tax=Haloactinopolyspora alba TaxID=648780 RepID=A0A2P8EF80_9ACTN|nr:hypothetical protein CLV30_10195 [Haloactinopolyspora alba]
MTGDRATWLLAGRVVRKHQVQVVVDPYLRRVHGTAFAVYTTRVGRFLPGLGRAHVGSSNLTGPVGTVRCQGIDEP